MHQEHTKLNTRRIGWTLAVIVLGVFVIGLATEILFDRYFQTLPAPSPRERWEQTGALIVAVKADKETFRGRGPFMYFGTYRVEFAYGDRRCSAWISAGVADTNEAWVRSQIAGTGTKVRIRYDPNDCTNAELLHSPWLEIH